MTTNFLIFKVGSTRCGVPADRVIEIVRAVAIMPVPGAPVAIAGIIDVRGSIVPVVDMRDRLGAGRRPVEPADNFVLVRGSLGASQRTVALHAGEVLELAEIDASAVVNPREDVGASPHVAGVARLTDGLALIHDVDAFLSAAEARTLDRALADRPDDVKQESR